MKINDESNVCVNVPFSVSETNETKNYNLFYIITENMRINLMKKSIKQSFIDISIRCIPSGISNYKILILSGFDLEDNKTKLLAIALIPNQKEVTITKFLSIMKNKYILSIDYNK